MQHLIINAVYVYGIYTASVGLRHQVDSSFATSYLIFLFSDTSGGKAIKHANFFQVLKVGFGQETMA